MNDLIKAIVLGVARNGAMALGGLLLKQGVVDASTATGVEGSVICLAGVALTVIDKFVVHRRITAAAAPVSK